MHILYDEVLDKFIAFSRNQEFELLCYYIYTYYNHDFNREEFIQTLEINKNSTITDTNTCNDINNKRKKYYKKNIRNIKPKYF